MNKIIENYYLEPNSTLVSYQEGTNGVDCWFDTAEIRQHRVLSYEDFNKIKATSQEVVYLLQKGRKGADYKETYFP